MATYHDDLKGKSKVWGERADELIRAHLLRQQARRAAPPAQQPSTNIPPPDEVSAIANILIQRLNARGRP